MSITKPETRAEFKEYCLRRLGAPVIQVNVADPQVEDLIDEALSFFQMNHYDGSVHLYLPVEVTSQVLEDRYFPLDETIIGIEGMLQSQIVGSGQFSLQWQLMASTVPYALKGDGLLTYSMAMSYQQTMREVLGSLYTPVRFNRHTDRLYLDTNWSQLSVGQIMVVKCVRAIDPEEFPVTWNDPFLKKYCTALIKRQWGNNLRKHRNIQLVGGVTIDAEGILQESEAELLQLNESILLEHQEPVSFFMA